MVMFSSVAREDVEPNCPYYQGTGDRTCKSGCWQEPSCITDEPLGGWLKPQHNEPNPILVWHRIARREDEEVRGTLDAATSHAWTLEDLDSMSREAHAVGPVTPAHIDHARRVLTRLASVTDEEN